MTAKPAPLTSAQVAEGSSQDDEASPPRVEVDSFGSDIHAAPSLVPAVLAPSYLPPASSGGHHSGERQHDYLQMILSAPVYDVAVESPVTLATSLTQRSKAPIYLKREDLQPVFSFKLRGAYNRMHNMSSAERAKGVLACSAGNHAQGVALAAKKMGVKATICMPVITPDIKIQAVKQLGAEVVLHGTDFDGAKAECMRLAALDGRLIIHPFDDPYIIAGNGTIGMEIMRQIPRDKRVHAIFCAVGGGGLVSGICAYVKRIFPHTRVFGVETFDACAMHKSLEKGERIELKEVGLFADGAAVRLVGQETFRVCKDLLDGIILVNNDEVCAAIKDAFTDTRSILEPAGALGIAGAKKYLENVNVSSSSVVVAVCSGANMNFSRLKFVAERAEVGEGKEAIYSVIIPETCGSLRKLHSVLQQRNITEFSYRYSGGTDAYIYISVTIRKAEERQEIVKCIEAAAMKATDLTDNELAKLHARYLIGGRSHNLQHERLFRFTFPERPGALKHFLHCLGCEINISLFHYRNIGGDVANVLVGLQVPPSETESFEKFLKQLGFPHSEETNNPVYVQFLK